MECSKDNSKHGFFSCIFSVRRLLLSSFFLCTIFLLFLLLTRHPLPPLGRQLLPHRVVRLHIGSPNFFAPPSLRHIFDCLPMHPQFWWRAVSVAYATPFFLYLDFTKNILQKRNLKKKKKKKKKKKMMMKKKKVFIHFVLQSRQVSRAPKPGYIEMVKCPSLCQALL